MKVKTKVALKATGIGGAVVATGFGIKKLKDYFIKRKKAKELLPAQDSKLVNSLSNTQTSLDKVGENLNDANTNAQATVAAIIAQEWEKAYIYSYETVEKLFKAKRNYAETQIKLCESNIEAAKLLYDMELKDVMTFQNIKTWTMLNLFSQKKEREEAVAAKDNLASVKVTNEEAITKFRNAITEIVKDEESWRMKNGKTYEELKNIYTGTRLSGISYNQARSDLITKINESIKEVS